MPVYFFWGEDDFALEEAIATLRNRVLDSQWVSFNYDKIPPTLGDALQQGLNQGMTPPFGAGGRLVWLVDTPLGQRCSEAELGTLKRTLPVLPATSTVVLSARTKPNGRLQSTKLLQKHAEIREFAPIAPWKTEQLVQRVQQLAAKVGVALTPTATALLAEAVGNDSRQLHGELEKLRLFAGEDRQPLDTAAIATLVTTTTQSSLQLATAIRQGQTDQALALVAELIQRNEPGLRIVATLVRQFRTWLWVKVLSEDPQVRSQGDRQQQIARAAEVGNPKRVYFLQREVAKLSVPQLQETLPILLDLELGLKQGAGEVALLQTKVIELCGVFAQGRG